MHSSDRAAAFREQALCHVTQLSQLAPQDNKELKLIFISLIQENESMLHTIQYTLFFATVCFNQILT